MSILLKRMVQLWQRTALRTHRSFLVWLDQSPKACWKIPIFPINHLSSKADSSWYVESQRSQCYHSSVSALLPHCQQLAARGPGGLGSRRYHQAGCSSLAAPDSFIITQILQTRWLCHPPPPPPQPPNTHSQTHTLWLLFTLLIWPLTPECVGEELWQVPVTVASGRLWMQSCMSVYVCVFVCGCACMSVRTLYVF